MPIRFVCELDDDKHVRLGVHVAFQWKDYGLIRTACGLGLDGEHYEWVDAETIVAPHRPPLTECPECNKLTVADLHELYGKWMRNE